ncbi:hypothetical protein [Dinoroseobacter sp. S375]|uniref:hypothetical protein n=1 Tax=Dinoroseobacter sp. S375 TaxID=3415136 RepID=UPI003C79A7C0
MHFLRFVLAMVSICAAFAAHAQDHSKRFKPHKFNGSKPVYSGGIWSFELKPQGCSSRKYGDGRGESDCLNGNIRSRIAAPKNVKPGQLVEYSMEIRIAPNFRYDGGPTPAWSKLEVAEWGRTKGIKNHIYDLQLDTVRGLTFERQVCVPPSKLSQWNKFQLRIKWSKSGDGFLEARCNGKVILSRRDQQTVIPPDCAAKYKLQCDPSQQIPSASIYWQVGPKLSGFGPNFAKYGFSSQFAPFPRNGILLQMRNLYAGNPPRS